MRRYLPLIALVLFLSACGGGTGTTVVGDGPGLTIQGRAFGQAPEIVSGEGFLIENLDSVRHTFSSPEDLWVSVDVPGSSEVEFTVPADLAPGTYDFVCRIHSGMAGSLTVTG